MSFIAQDHLCKANMKIKDSYKINQTQFEERRNFRCSLKKIMTFKSTLGCLGFLLINAQGFRRHYNRKNKKNK